MASTEQRLGAALEYAEREWPVLPLYGVKDDGTCSCMEGRECSSPGKHPLTRSGLKEATTEPEMIRAWFRRWPNMNIGLLTGVAFDVVDIDDPTGDAWWNPAGEAGYEHPAGMTVVTGSGGLHIYVAPSGLGNRARMAEHIDYRGRGGYVVAPPSTHSSGRDYAWT